MLNIVGKTEVDAENTLKREGKKMRVTERDGKPFMVTMDYWPDRINVAIERGKVSQIVSVG